MQPNQDGREGAFVARQPILNAVGLVFGYELLYRGGANESGCDGPLDVAGARVLNDAVLTIGLDTLTDGRRAFINITTHMLLSGFATLLPAQAVVLEIAANAPVDSEIIETCRRLRELGYALAVDNFVEGCAAEALLPHVSYVKVDVLATTPAQWKTIQRMIPNGIRLVAEKVETAEIHEATRAAGYQLFQGYYFCRPKTISAGAMSGSPLAYAQLFAALNRPDVSITMLEDLIKRDASLTYRVLRCINSAASGVKREVQSIRQALVLLGLGQVRKWASVWVMAGLNEGRPSELITLAVVRARSCELLAQRLFGAEAAPEFFLLGLCSLLDAMLGRPMKEAVEGLPLSASVRCALLGEQNAARSVLDTVVAHERGLWNSAATLAGAAGITPGQLTTVYVDALKWARELSGSGVSA